MLIRTKDLIKTYELGEIEVPALKDIDLEIENGEFISVMGPSGSGKSTLLNLVGCLDTPTSGKYFLDGIEITPEVNLAKIRSEKIGFVFQTFNLLPRLTALENVEVPMIYYCGGEASARRAEQLQGAKRRYKGVSAVRRKVRAAELLESVGLGDRIKHRPNELSGGERQRVAIARALANNPPLILADEPTGNLDSKSGAEILKVLTDLNRQGTTLIMVTHEKYIAEQADRIINIFDGRIT